MHKNINHAGALMRAGKKVSAAWLSSGSPISAEILAQAGYDVLLIDMEHGPGNILTLIAQIQAMKGEAAVPFVRSASNDPVEIKRILDAGAYGIIVPYVCNAEEAKCAVKACRYPPEGIRGISGSTRATNYGRDGASYFATANKDIFVFVQIESPEGVAGLDEILEVQGVDGIIIGPLDLATTHGFLGNAMAPEIQAIIQTIEKKVVASGKALGTVCSDFEDAKAKYERGYNLITLVSDTVTLGKVGRREVQRFQSEVLHLDKEDGIYADK